MATHGEKNIINCHPHISMCGNFSIVHNGIIENYNTIKNELIEKNYSFVSQTDTEVIVNLISYYYKNNSIYKSIKKTINKLKGSWALVIQYKNTPNKLYFTKYQNPLLIANNNNSAMIVSELSGFCNNYNDYFIMNDYDIEEISFNNNKN